LIVVRTDYAVDASAAFGIANTGDSYQDDCADEGDNDRSDHASASRYSELLEDPTAENATQKSEDDVYDRPVAAALHHLAREPASDETYYNPRENAHDVLLGSCLAVEHESTETIRLTPRVCNRTRFVWENAFLGEGSKLRMNDREPSPVILSPTSWLSLVANHQVHDGEEVQLYARRVLTPSNARRTCGAAYQITLAPI
jgi:hypothetical protein